jgi:membrane associated rhomboid family serine protease
MEGYYRSSYRQRSPLGQLLIATPTATRALIGACTVMFLAQLIAGWTTGGVAGDQLVMTLGLVPARFLHGWIFQAITYAFLHGGFSHFLLNMLTLWMFGSEMERLWGGARYLRYYTICTLGAALCTVALDWKGVNPTIGASGAIMGLMVAYAVAFPNRTLLLYFVIPVQAKWLVLGLLAMQVLFYKSYVGSGIAVVAHLGGALFGYLTLKRVWRVREFFQELRWKLKRRRFRVMPKGGNGDPFAFH